MELEKDFRVAFCASAALAAAIELCEQVYAEDFDDDLLIFDKRGPELSNDLAHAGDFLASAGDIGGEPVFRFMAARGMHFLPADGYFNASPWVRLFFGSWTESFKALLRLLTPAAAGPLPVLPPARAVPLHETIYERNGSMAARIGEVPGVVSASGYRPPVFLIGEAPAVQPPVPAAPGITVPPGIVMVMDRPVAFEIDAGAIRRAPSRDEFQAMSPEARRQWAHLFDPRFVEDGITSRAPDASGFIEEFVDVPGIGKQAVMVPPSLASSPAPARSAPPETAAASPPDAPETAAPAAEAPASAALSPADRAGQPKKAK